MAAAEKEFADTMAILTEKRNEVVRLEEQLRILNEKLDEAVKEQTRLQDSVELCNNKLVRAQKLIGTFAKFKIDIKYEKHTISFRWIGW